MPRRQSDLVGKSCTNRIQSPPEPTPHIVAPPHIVAVPTLAARPAASVLGKHRGRHVMLPIRSSAAAQPASSGGVGGSSLAPVLLCVGAACAGSLAFGYHLAVVNGPLEAISADLGIAGDAALQGLVGALTHLLDVGFLPLGRPCIDGPLPGGLSSMDLTACISAPARRSSAARWPGPPWAACRAAACRTTSAAAWAS